MIMLLFNIAILLLVTSLILQIILFKSKKIWGIKAYFSIIIAVLQIISLMVVLIISPIIGLIYAYILFYSVFNLFRIHNSRLSEDRLYSVSTRTSRIMTILLPLALLSVGVIEFSILVIPVSYLVASWLVLSLALASTLLIATIINVYSTRPKQTDHLSSDELPTITIAIAARNETPTLTACLESIVNSDYPKLEVLVLDDESQDNTAEIIKSFAQNGVRFVNSENQIGRWLAKNKAYQTLLDHSSGEYILYMGVDVRLHNLSLRRIAEYIATNNFKMITLVPKRTKSGAAATLIQPLRYWWEFAIPQIISRRPPALSTCWVVNRKSLESIGGFKSYKRSIVPEMHLAKYFSQINSYSFIRTTKDMLVTTHKDLGSQWDTLIRTRYPIVHRRPEEVLWQTIIIFSFVILPFIILPIAIIFGYSTQLLAVVAIVCSLYMMTHIYISIFTNPLAAWFAPLNFPISMALDLVGLHISMYKYEFSRVIWKGRDVAPKKLKVIPSLPELKDI
jgi:glycosyltransferase involved in cell wall biosynthesis